jgi:hypothetical protein
MILSILFGINRNIFFNPMFIGHQARELFTHTLVTLPLAIGSCLLVADTTSLEQEAKLPHVNFFKLLVLSGGLSTAIIFYLGVGVVKTNATAYSQAPHSYGSLIFTHFFEHFFTYLIVVITSPFLYLLFSRWNSITARVSCGMKKS